MSDFQTFLEKNRTRSPEQPTGENFDVRQALGNSRQKKSERGVIPYATNAVNSINRGLTQVVETPYNIVNRAPQLVNLLPGEQGVGSIDEMAEGTPFEKIFPSKDPLIELAGEHYPGMDETGGINNPNPNYPRTSQFAEDVGLGVGSLGAAGLVAKFAPGAVGKTAAAMYAPVQAAPKAAVGAEVLASGGAATGRELVPEDAGPIARFMGEFLGALAPGSLAYSGPQVVNRTLGREGGMETLEAMEKVGIRPSVGSVGNQTASQLENGAAIVPVLGTAAKRVQSQQMDEFADIMTDTAAKARPDGAIPNTGEIMLGEQVRDMSEAGLNRLKGEFGKREDALMEAIGPTSGVDVSATRQAIEDMIPRVDPELQGALKTELSILDEMAGNTGLVPYEQLRSFRTNVGRRTNQPSLKGGQSKQIYKAITQDTQALAESAGVGDDFTKLMSDQANAYDKTARLVDGGDVPAMKKLAEGQNEAGRNFFKQGLKNPDRIAMLKRNSTPEQWQQFAGDTAEYLGLSKDAAQGAAGDMFSPNTFLTNWNQMDPRSRNILFDDDIGTLGKLEEIAKAAEGLQMRGNASNFSNTAGVGMSAAALTGPGAGFALGNAPGAAVGAGTTYAGIKALMSETMAKWAAGRTPSVEKTLTSRVPGATTRALTEEDQ